MSTEATPSGLRSTLETLSDRAVPGTERLAIGSWWLRAGFGVTGRANSTWAPGPPSGSVPDAVDEVEAWYRSRGLTPRFQIFDGLAVDTMWLQVQSDNEGAVALYRSVGFDSVHRYRYTVAPDR